MSPLKMNDRVEVFYEGKSQGKGTVTIKTFNLHHPKELIIKMDDGMYMTPSDKRLEIKVINDTV